MYDHKLSIVVLTYKRVNELIRCVNSISNSALLAKTFIRLSVFNNDPDSPISKEIFSVRDDFVEFNCVNRSHNIGPRNNFYESIVFELEKSDSDYILFLSDDDYLLPDFLPLLVKYLELSADALISSAIVIPEVSNTESNYKLTDYTFSIRPTRPWRDLKVQFMTDSRLFSGTIYSRSILSKFIDYCTSSPLNKAKYLEYWYPMAFIASYSSNPMYMKNNLLVHTQNNLTHWGEIDFMEEFFFNRIDMFFDCHRINNITYYQYLCLVSDFLAFQPLEKQVKFVFDKRNNFRLIFPWLFKLIRVLLIIRPVLFLFKVSRKFSHYANYLVKL